MKPIPCTPSDHPTDKRHHRTPCPQMTLSGGVQAQFYNLDDKILATFDRHLTQDVNEFLFEQQEVDFLTLDSRQIYPPGRAAKK